MAVQFMSADAQNRLLGLAKQAVEIARDGDCSPSEALAKVASENQLNADEINRVKEAINTAAVLALRKRAAAGDGFSDDVIPLVNSEEVLGRVFKAAPAPDALALKKVAAEADVEETRSFLNAPAATFAKAASAESTSGGVLDRSQLYDRAHGQVGQIKIAAEIHREAAASHRINAERRIGDVLDIFRGTAAPAFAEVEKVASALYPEEGLGLVFDMIFKGGELDKIGHRRHTGELPKYASVNDHADIIAKIKTIRDEIGHSLLAKIAEDELRAKATVGDIALLKLGNEDAFGLGGITDAAGGLLDKTVSGAKEMSPALEAGVDSLAPAPAKHSINERLKRELANDRIRVVLAKVTNDDPVVSKYPKDKVIQAYNELTTLQPSLTNQPLALRAALRRHLVSGGDFTMQEAGQLYDFNKERDKARAMAPPKVDPSMMGPAPAPGKKSA
jgi:hypothetical protein